MRMLAAMELSAWQAYVADRRRLADQIARHTGIDDARLLEAFRRVPRHRFVPEPMRSKAHEDRALPIGKEQTISQPSMIALMLDALQIRPEHHVLEVGAGSGYAAALLGELAAEVDAIEVLPELCTRAEQTLRELGVSNVHIHCRNGAYGLPERAPFDRILVSAGAQRVPPSLVGELAVGGRIAIPVGEKAEQILMVGERVTGDRIEWESRTPCLFVPLVGDEAGTS
jgi:protein-L-isoaspartate(D-aspartate) O-methyltransferase